MGLFEWRLMVSFGNSSRCCWSAVFITVICVFFRGPSKLAGMENVVTARYVKELVEEQGKTHKEVADILRQQHPGVNGLSAYQGKRVQFENYRVLFSVVKLAIFGHF